MKRTITVLQDDIDNGVPRNAHKCAVARAARRDLADLAGEECGLDVFAVTRDTLYASFRSSALPPSAHCAVRDFDNGRDVSPFKFEVDLVEPGLSP